MIDQSINAAKKPTGFLRTALVSACRVLTLLLLVVALFSFVARFHWIADLLANLRMQQLIGTAIVLLLCGLTKLKREMLLVGAVLTVHLFVITAASSLIPRSVPTQQTSSTFTLMSLNVLTQNQQHDRIVKHITDVSPDVVAILELSADLTARLEQQLSTAYPHRIFRSSDAGNFGIGLMSKTPLTESEVFQLNETIPSIEVVTQGIRVIATHPLPPMNASQFESRNEHLSALAQRVRNQASTTPDIPVVLLGDLNVTPWSPLFSELQIDSGLTRAYRGLGITPTWYASGDSFPMGLILDHVLIDRRFECVEFWTGEEIGSDHRSVAAKIRRREAVQ